MSDFDEKDILPESDFDSADVVAEEPSREPNLVEAKPQSDDPVGDSTRALMGGTVGAGVGAGVNAGLGKLTNLVMNNIGNLDGDQIQKIADNRDIYPTVSPIEQKFNEYKELGAKTRQGGIDNAAKARKGLPGLSPISVEEYKKLVAKPVLENLNAMTGNLAPNKAEELLASRMDEIAPKLEAERMKAAELDGRMNDLDNAMKAPYLDERMAINQAAKEAQFGRKMEQLSAPLPENPKAAIMDEFQSRQSNQKLSQLEQLLEQAKAKTPQDAVNRADDFRYLRDNDVDKNEKIRELIVERGGELDHEMNKIHDDHAERKFAIKGQRIDEKIVKTEEKIAKDIDKIEQKKQAFQSSMAERAEKTQALREAGKETAQTRLQARKDQLQFNKIIADEKATMLKAVKQRERLEKLMEQKAKLEADKQKTLAKVEKKVLEARDAAKDDLAKAVRTPRNILDVAPELEGKVLGEEYVTPLQKAASKADNVAELTPERLDRIVQEFREGDINFSESGPVNNFYKDMSRSVSGKLKEMSPDVYAPNMAKAEESFKTEELLKKLGIGYNKELDRVTLENPGKTKINNVLLEPEKMTEEYGFLKEALEDAKRQGNLPADANIDEMLRSGEVSALKNEVDRLKQGKKLSSFEVDAAATADIRRAPGIVGKLGGTKLQELYGLYKDSKVGEAIKTGGKYGLPVVGALAGGAAAADAAVNDELSVPAAVAAGTAEAFNPLPGADFVEGAKEASKAIDETIAQTPREMLLSYPDASGDLLDPGAQLTQQNPVVSNALKGFAKGFVSPIPGLVQETGEKLEGAGFKLSEGARTRMEQNMKAADMFKAKEPTKSHEDFRSFVEQRPEQIQELAQLFSSDEKLQSFVAPLEKAANADGRTRSAVLFGLYQQPAFRAAIKAKAK